MVIAHRQGFRDGVFSLREVRVARAFPLVWVLKHPKREKMKSLQKLILKRWRSSGQAMQIRVLATPLPAGRLQNVANLSSLLKTKEDTLRTFFGLVFKTTLLIMLNCIINSFLNYGIVLFLFQVGRIKSLWSDSMIDGASDKILDGQYRRVSEYPVEIMGVYRSRPCRV